MKIVTSFGGVYRLTDKEYEVALRGIVNGTGYDLPSKRYLGESYADLASLDAEEAKSLLLTELS